MHNTFTKSLFIFCVFAALGLKPAFAQTITIHNFIPGTYSPGSTIGVPFEVSGTCIKQDNTYNLYLASSSGTILSNSPIGSFSGFYGTFVNGIIPASTAPGTYTVVVKSTDPVATSAPSPVFTVVAGAAVNANITGPPIDNNPGDSNIFGNCGGAPNSQYFFTNNSGNAFATANIFNESSQAAEGAIVLSPTGSFTAQATNYTINVQTTNGTTISTEAYMLINNVVNNSFGATNGNTVCLLSAGGGTLTYNLDITSANGLQNNFPGNTYLVTWGDGLSTIYTICDLINSGGQISHTYTTGSCGHTVNGQNNAFEVDVQPQSAYCGIIGTRITSYARIIRAPTNSFTSPATACTGSQVTFNNTSDPGQDANANANSCLNPNALYTWSVDGTVVLPNVHQSQNFTYTFTTNGNHTVTLTLQSGSAGPCTAQPVTHTICIQNAPQPAFTIPATACLTTPVTPTDQSVIDEGCNPNPYLWTITSPPGAGPVTFVGGTNNGSRQPQIQFSTPGVYTVTLSISSGSCATATVSHTINIDGPPTITMSQSTSICGSNLTYNFNPNPGPTQTTVTGTAVSTATTYAWTVTGGNFSFVGGTSASSQYPQINFTDFATYTISVTETNSCGQATKSQQITFQNAPTVTISASANPICPGSAAALTATINGSYNSFTWIGAGTFSAPGSLTTNYTPTPSEITAGRATVTIDVKTSLAGQCADIQQNITINIYPVDNITSALVKQICTGSGVNYNITSSVPNSTFTWTAALTSGTASGFNGGSGALINDVLTNNGPGDAVVTYTITPKDPNGCTGPPSTLKVTVKPLSAVTATPANNTICSGSTAGISLSPTIAGTTYTWSSTVSGSITNNSQQSTPTATNIINDVLNNTGATAGSVTYVITPYNTTCPGPSTTVTINVQPLPATANAGPNDEQCNITSYTLNGNTPPAGNGHWSVVSGPAGATFADATQPSTTVSGLTPGNTYQFSWTITIPGCQSSSNTITLKDDAASVGGTTAGAATVCSGSNNGNVTLSGQVGNILRWELSTDGGTTWNPIPNTTTTQQYVNLTATTQYRAVIQSGVCAIAFSSVTTITVNPPPVQSNAGPNDEVCNVTSYTLQGNSPAPYTGKWTVTAGPAGATFADATQPNTTVSGLVPGNIYQFTWTITAPAPCATNSSAVVITDDAPTAGGTTGANTTVCSGSNNGTITLSGQVGKIIRWESSTDNGATWNPIANSGTIQQYSNLTITTQYRAFVQSGVCSSAFSSVTIITVSQPAVQANAGPNQELCNTATYTLQGNNPAPGSGQWTVTSGPAGATFSDATQPNAVVSGLVPGAYQFTWSITPQAPCTSNSSTVTIIVDSATVGGTTATNATVCAGSNSGTITLSGRVGNIIRWELSADNGTTWTPIANTSTSQQYLNLNTTTQYRAVVQSGVCQTQFSSVTTITVNQPVVQADAGGNQALCGAVSATLQGNDPTPFTGSWTQTAGPAATIVSPNSSQTQVTGLTPGNDYTFVWTIQGQPPCANSSSTTQIHDAADVTPSFTADKTDNCGTYTVNFTNTSTVLTGTTFLWDFGDGATSSAVSPAHTFIQRSDGKDTTYTVTLSVVNNCAPHPPFTLTITVRPKDPIAAILPDQLTGCSPFVIRVANKSPGNNTGYVFYLYDGATLVQQINKTDKSTAVFNPVSSPPAASKTYTVYMVATGFCSNTTESTHVPVTVSPPTVTAQMFIQGSVNKGCTPLAVTFVNNSSGGDSYFYTIYDVNNQPVAHLAAGTADYPYTFTTVGTYFVTITGTNNCSSSESPKTRVDVYTNPQPQFDADVKSGCKQVTVNFKNLTPDDPATPATSLSYTWDFGDNTQSTAFTPPPHTFGEKGSPYTITLTATNAGSGCSSVVTKTSFVVVTSPPATDFTERPDSVISIPNYTFAFSDQTTGSPVSWSWTFGDGKSSTVKNPSHTYADTGLYRVTLTTANQSGCDSTVHHNVRITGIPGQLFLPNAFEPDGSTPELRVFMAKGSGIKQWHMQIFNNYSQLIWETTKLNDKGQPVDGWDGMINGSPAPQGVYIWQVSATFINGTEWKGNSYNGSLPKRVGVIHLIR